MGVDGQEQSRNKETAYVMINCELGSEESILDQLRSTEGVKEAQGTYGSYDIITKIETKSIESLRDILTFQIRKIEKIKSTTTVVCAK